MKKLILSNKEKLTSKEMIAKLYDTFENVIERYGSIFIFDKGVVYRVKMFDLISLVFSDDDLEVEGSSEYTIDPTRAISMQYSAVVEKVYKSNIVELV